MGGGKKEKRSQAKDAKAKDPSWNFYYCPYILRTGEVCNRRCYDPKGCKVHRNSPKQYPCIEPGCDKKLPLDMVLVKIIQASIVLEHFINIRSLKKFRLVTENVLIVLGMDWTCLGVSLG